MLRYLQQLLSSAANQRGVIPLLMLVAVIGILSFVALTSVLPFKDRLMSSLFPKDSSKAAVIPWDGVPDLPVDYSQDVWAWWYNHPFNQESPNYRPDITSPSNQINVQSQYGGNIQAAIDALPSSGGTLIFPAGTYNGTFEIIGKNNIHFIGQGTVVFNVTGESYIGGCRYSTDGAINYAGFTNGVKNNDPATMACVTTGRAKNIYFNNIIFDGGNTALQAMNLAASKNILFDSITLRNFADPGTHHRGLISGNAVLENIWFRNSQFLGKERYALYLDGLHGGGVINSTVNGQFGSGGFLFLTNDDLSFDLDKNGTLDQNEKRTADHVVVAYNTYASPIYNGVSATGREVLVYKNNFQFGINAVAAFDAKSSHISPAINYTYFGNRVISNTTNGLNYFAEFAPSPDCPKVTNCSKQGKYFVMGNKAQNANSFDGLVLEKSNTFGSIEGPNEVTGNCVNDAACVPVGPVLPVSAASPTVSALPSSLPSDVNFPIGVFEDGNMIWGRTTDFTAMIDNLQSKGLNSVMFINNTSGRDESMLTVSDQKNFNVFMSGTGNTNSFLNDTTPTIEEARAAVYPVVDAYKTHPSVKGYNVGDEPTLQQQQQINMMVQAYKERDPNKIISPVFIAFNRGDTIYSSSNPTAFFMDAYPFNATSTSCDFAMKGMGMPTYSMSQYISQLTRNKPADQPLYLILQAHSFGTPDGYNLRVPSIPELRGQHWIALGEGADGIFWFIYSSQQGWTGLKDAPTLMNEISSLALRTNAIKDILLNANKNATNLFTASNGAYVSTLTSKDGFKKYAVVANIGNCSGNQNITINSTQGGTLKDLETGQLIPLGQAVSFPPGDGKIFELVAEVPSPSIVASVAPLASVQGGVNLITNGSFEQGSAGWSINNGTIDTTAGQDGNNALKVIGPADIYSRFNIDLKPNTSYMLSYWIKTDNVTGVGATMRYVQLTPAVSMLLQPPGTPYTTGTTGWTNIKRTFTTPSTYLTGRLDALYKLNLGDTAWYDNIQLCEVTCDQPINSGATSSKKGDVNNDNKVDIFDYNLLLTNFGKLGTSVQGDVDGNGKVDIFDYNELLTNFGK